MARPCGVDVTPRQAHLQGQLVEALREAVPAEADLDRAIGRSHHCYQAIAAVLIELRHEFSGPDGESYDLRGRSSGYRMVVREAYAKAGADAGWPIPKRLTAGVAYWVRKLLIERYGQDQLYLMGVLRGPIAATNRSYARAIEDLPEDPAVCLSSVIGILNALAVEPDLVPSEDVVRAAFRAVLLLRAKLDSQLAPSGPGDLDAAERPLVFGPTTRLYGRQVPQPGDGTAGRAVCALPAQSEESG